MVAMDCHFYRIFAARSSTVAYLRTSILLGHSTVDLGSLAAIQQREREEIGSNTTSFTTSLYLNRCMAVKLHDPTK